MERRLEIFCCYARKDQELLLELKEHLTPLQRQGLITLRTDIDITAGKAWEEEIHQYLKTAQIILLLVSPSFMASDYCYSVEMQQAIDRHECGEARVIPVILRPVAWEKTPIGKLQALPADARPIVSSKWLYRDEAFYNVVEGLRDVVETYLAEEKLTHKAKKVEGVQQFIGAGQAYSVGEKRSHNVSQVKEKLCPYCQALNGSSVRFCAHCGRQMPQQITNRATEIDLSPRKDLSNLLAIGTPLQSGRYIVKKVLGQGGIGAALLATDKRLDSKLVVIKELLSDSHDPTKLKENELNFKREVVILAHLDHPLIPNVTDNFEEDSRFFMVQDYVEGENLEDHMDRLNQPMKELDVLISASEILDVLDYLSQQTPSIVHRDIKPANIIISSKGKKAHLVDFGIARADVARNAKRKQTSALGTPGYAPPEQYQGNADLRSDLYALGATLHHLLTNRDPRNYQPFSYPPVRTLNPQLSPEVESLLVRALNNNMSQRYQSATAMKSDVDQILYKRFGIAASLPI